MGEVVVSSDEALEPEALREAELEMMKCDSAGGSSVTVRWERFLPRMVLRVLLVEADDSTRQIITALLKKCSYKVAAVPDGLKAWEVLRGNAHNIDLILTEVELPSISGFALLTLIMEHETCKNIPVIMMSSNDSINTVYNCMLRGAADFLVKPVRRNELKNLWQHVWRRQPRLAILKSSPQDESVALKKVEATAENNSNHSSGYKSCEMTSKDRGNDSQTSCTKPDVEAGSTCMGNLQGPSQLEWSRSMTGELGTQIQNHGGTVTLAPQLLLKQENEAAGISLYQMPAPIDEARSVFWKMNVEHNDNRGDPNNTSDTCDNNGSLLSTSKTAIDLIGAFDNSSYQNPGPITGQNKFDSFPQLDLSLRRSHFCGSEGTDEKQTLNHSNASAFAPYVNNRASLPLHPMLHSLCPQEECGTNNDRNLPTHVLGYNSDTSVSTMKAPSSVLSMATGHLKEAQAPPCPQGRAIPSTVPVSNLKFDGPPMFHTQSGPAPLPSSDNHQDGALLQNKCQSNIETGGSKPIRTNPEDPKLELDDDQGQFSTATADHESAGVRFCNGTSNQQTSIVCGSICGSNGSSYPSATGGNVEGLSAHDGSSHKSSQREAALNKFRMKRKDRCFEKKVRYESRKKLAEQRPRVKGQFVRQVQLQHASLGAEYC